MARESYRQIFPRRIDKGTILACVSHHRFHLRTWRRSSIRIDRGDNFGTRELSPNLFPLRIDRGTILASVSHYRFHRSLRRSPFRIDRGIILTSESYCQFFARGHRGDLFVKMAQAASVFDPTVASTRDGGNNAIVHCHNLPRLAPGEVMSKTVFR